MRLLIEVLCVVCRAAGSFAEMLWQGVMGFFQSALWVLCLLMIAGTLVTGLMAVATHRGQIAVISVECLALAGLAYVTMSLVAHFRYWPHQRTTADHGEYGNAGIYLPPIRRRWWWWR